MMVWCKRFKVCDKEDNFLFMGTRVEIMEKFNMSQKSFYQYVARTMNGEPIYPKYRIYSPGRLVYTGKDNNTGKFVFCGTVPELAKEWGLSIHQTKRRLAQLSVSKGVEMIREYEFDLEEDF